MVDPDWVTEGSKTRKNIIVLGEREKGQSVDAGPLTIRQEKNRWTGKKKKGEANDLKRTCGRQERGKIIQNKKKKRKNKTNQ